MNTDQPVFRFAPSPNGALHLGHALSALENEKSALKIGGRLLLRIEDIDQNRCSTKLEQALIRDLQWLGIDFEQPYFRQSEHFADYQAALERLIAKGLAYPSFLSRGQIKQLIIEHEKQGEIWPRGPDGAPLYPEIDKNRTPAERTELINSGQPYAWRLDMKKALQVINKTLYWAEEKNDTRVRITAYPERWGDIVLSRSDAPSSYHLSVVIDDASQGISHVVRGKDLYQATAIHRVLQELLNLPAPIYRHHRLLLDQDGNKLSKSRGDTALATLRNGGKSVSEIRFLCGFNSQKKTTGHSIS